MKPDAAIIETPVTPLRVYPAPWNGELVLVCNKCRKKLKKRKGADALSNLRKWFKKRSKSDASAPEIRIVGIDCVKMCPKGGLTVSTQHQLGNASGPVSILRSEADLESFYVSICRSQIPS